MSSPQQSNSVMHIHTSILFQILIGCHRILGSFCAIQQVPVGQSFHMTQCAYANPKSCCVSAQTLTLAEYLGSHYSTNTYGNCWLSSQHSFLHYFYLLYGSTLDRENVRYKRARAIYYTSLT